MLLAIPRPDQTKREKAYDEGLDTVERELKRARGSRSTAAGRLETQQRVTAAFARFSAAALDLSDDCIELLTTISSPWVQSWRAGRGASTQRLSMPDIIQACRNAWTASGLQPLLGVPIGLTPSILGYSLLYPYSDNYLDGEDVTAEAKLRFSQRFRQRLRGEIISQRPMNAKLRSGRWWS